MGKVKKLLIFYPGGNPNELLYTARCKRKWRPTIVAVVQYKNSICVTTEIVRRRLRWTPGRKQVKRDLPKGGIDAGESMYYALVRELREEIRLPCRYVSRIKFLGHAYIPFDQDNNGRDGYTKGKLYLICGVRITKPCVAPGRNHRVIGLSWRSDFANHFPENKKKRLLFTQPAFRSRLNILMRKR